MPYLSREPARSLFLPVMAVAALAGVLAMVLLWGPRPASVAARGQRQAGPAAALDVRMGVEQLRNPYWYERHGQPEQASRFWDKKHWERALEAWSQDGYNAVLYWVEPWTETAWQAFLIRHKEFPEARELTRAQSDRVIGQVNWIFHKAHELGLKNFLFTYHIVTTTAFAKAHGMDEQMAVSASVDFRHNLKGQMGPAFGVRNRWTRAFTEAAIAEVFRTYPELDGLNGGMAEAVPGKKSSWYREAVAPGLRRCGRRPVCMVMNWMMPLEDFLADVAPAEVYDNTWLSVQANVEMFTDARPYPLAFRWAEQAGRPTILELVHHNHEAGFPVNSPRLAYEVVRQYRRVENCRGFLAWYLRDDPNDLFRKALGYYGREDVPYSDGPWVGLLEKRFGDRRCAEHFLKAYDAAARIPGEVSALAWVPHDLGTSRQLMLPYWYWTEQDPRWSYLASPARGGVLLPVRHYAKVVARLGEQYRGNSGARYGRNLDHPGAQELVWGLGDYPITPEAHMTHVRRLGETCLREAGQALDTVKTNREEAVAVYNSMKAYKLLTDYYERKVLAAVSALIYGFGGKPADRADALRLADEAVERYEKAIGFIWKEIDRKSGKMKARWLDGQVFTLPELIAFEKKERGQLGKLFHWPAERR